VLVSLDEVHGIAGCRQCPFFQGHRCAIHPHRPVDCRTYPMVPVFGDTTIQFRVSGVCPKRAGMDEPFIRLMTGVWQRLTPHLPEAWRKHFNARQPREYLEPLVKIG
jgi:Fe-S-cluster containining protein